MTPVSPAAAPVPSFSAPAAQVALAGFDSPLTELIGTLGLITNNLFSTEPVVGLPEINVGLVPDFIAQQLPIISQLGYNGSDYLNFTFDALSYAAGTLSEGIWNLPEAVVTAGRQLIDGEFTDALGTLIAATVVPIQTAASAALGAGVYVFDGVLRRASAVLALVPSLVGGLAQNLLDNANVLVGSAIAIVDGVVDGISSGQFDDAWNAVVDGLLGPTGLPGAVVNATIGLGNGSGKAFVPSIRTAVTQGVQDIAEAIAVPVLPGAAVRSAAAVDSATAPVSIASSAVRAAAASASEAAAPSGVAAPTAPDVQDDSPAPAEDAPAKHRVSRKAAADG